jgi:hypothetical protein
MEIKLEIKQKVSRITPFDGNSIYELYEDFESEVSSKNMSNKYANFTF